MNTINEDLSIAIPISQKARQLAQQLAQQQPTAEKAAQVQLNTLAVLVVHHCLQMLGIDTNLAASDSWNSVMRLCTNAADLVVPGVGRLECRGILASASSCQIPLEVWEDRVAYVVVKIDEACQEGKILGFAATAAVTLEVHQLQPIETLIQHLYDLKNLGINSAVKSRVVDTNQWVQLSQWFNNIFEAGWQPVEAFLSPNQTHLAFNFRNTQTFDADTDPEQNVMIRRGRLIDLGMQLAGYPVALIVELKPDYEARHLTPTNFPMSVRLQVHPVGEEIYLPPDLKLMVLDETGNSLKEVQARSADNYIQVKMRGQPGEQFQIRLALGDANITEYFVI